MPFQDQIKRHKGAGGLAASAAVYEKCIDCCHMLLTDDAKARCRLYLWCSRPRYSCLPPGLGQGNCTVARNEVSTVSASLVLDFVVTHRTADRTTAP